jgi:DNA-damage-inducible protein J
MIVMREGKSMTKSAMIRARIDPDLKEETEDVFKRLGLSTTQAITLFYQQVNLHQGLPFEVRIPNETTRRTFEDTDAGKNVIGCQDIDDMFDKLGL